MNKLVEIRGHTFLANALGNRPRVLDLGANHGEFSRAMVERFGVDARMVEANPVLYNELKGSRICPCFHAAVIGNSAKTVQLNLAANDEGSSILALPDESAYGSTLTETIEVPARTMDSLLQKIGWSQVDLIKIDIEGAEVEVLDSLDNKVLDRIAQISVEFHSDSWFHFELEAQVEQCLRRLAQAGFIVIDLTFPRRINVLLVNTKLIRVPLTDRLKWRLFYNPPLILHRTLRALLPKEIRQAINRFKRRLAGQPEATKKP